MSLMGTQNSEGFRPVNLGHQESGRGYIAGIESSQSHINRTITDYKESIHSVGKFPGRPRLKKQPSVVHSEVITLI